jgi:hypothetical protein
MRVKEIIGESASFVGTCVNSFDEDGYCTVPELGYNDVTDFAQAEENSIKITKDEFIRHVSVPKNLITKNSIFLFDRENQVFMLYDSKTDIHYFFT